MSTDGIPTPKEVARQLEHLLASGVFAPQPAKVLEFIVNQTLARKKVTETLLRRRVFTRKVNGKTKNEKFKYDSSIARTTMNAVRASLAKYYANDGKDDLVIIDVPPRKNNRTPGDAYRPLFRYNPRHRVAQVYERIEYLIQHGDGPVQIWSGLKLLPETYAPGSIPDHSFLLMAEGFVRLVATNWEPSQHFWMLVYARELFTTLEPVIPDAWRVCVGFAAIDTCESKLAAARRRFARAESLDRSRTRASTWYALFLLKAGDRKKLLEVAERYAEEITDPVCYALRGIIFYRAGLVQESRAAFLYSLDLDRNCWAAHLGLTLWHCASGDMDQAEIHAQRLRELLHPDDLACFVSFFTFPAPENKPLIESAPEDSARSDRARITRS